MATNIAKVSNVISITVGSAEPKYYFKEPGKYWFSTAQDTVFVQMGTLPGVDEFTIAFSDLRVNGQTPTSVSNARVLLNAVFSS